MNSLKIFQATMGRLPKELTFFLKADYPTVLALTSATESGSAADIKKAFDATIPGLTFIKRGLLMTNKLIFPSLAWRQLLHPMNKNSFFSIIFRTILFSSILVISSSLANAEAKLDQADFAPPVTSLEYPKSFPGPWIEYGNTVPLCSAVQDPSSFNGGRDGYKYIISGLNGWLFRTADFRVDYMLSEQAKHYYKKLVDALDKKGQKLFIVLQPPRTVSMRQYVDLSQAPPNFDPTKAQINFQNLITEFKELGIYSTDLSTTPPDMNYFYMHDLHWTSDGAKWSAQQVAKNIRDIPDFESIEKKQYLSQEDKNEVLWHAGFSQFVQKTCNINIAETPAHPWVVTEQGTDSTQDLLGETKFPEIVIVGTSNSLIASSNFTGWLKGELSTDIYNAAIIGGGFGSSIARYLASDEYKEYPPKILIWEFLAPHNTNTEAAINKLREMIPAVYGACPAEGSYATHIGQIKKLKFKILDDLTGQKLKDSYIYLEIKDPVVRTLRLEILYEDGEADDVDLSRNNRIENKGRYFYEVDKRKILFIKVITDIPEGQIEARICNYNDKS